MAKTDIISKNCKVRRVSMKMTPWTTPREITWFPTFSDSALVNVRRPVLPILRPSGYRQGPVSDDEGEKYYQFLAFSLYLRRFGWISYSWNDPWKDLQFKYPHIQNYDEEWLNILKQTLMPHGSLYHNIVCKYIGFSITNTYNFDDSRTSH